MVWYPSVDDVVDVNVGIIDATRDKHPHKLLLLPLAIESVLGRVRQIESRGIMRQAAVLMKELVGLHPFAGGNHRTAYIVAKLFLRRNGQRPRVARLEDAYAFIGEIERKRVEEVEEWLKYG